jgi:hypothetical protein
MLFKFLRALSAKSAPVTGRTFLIIKLQQLHYLTEVLPNIVLPFTAIFIRRRFKEM